MRCRVVWSSSEWRPRARKFPSTGAGVRSTNQPSDQSEQQCRGRPGRDCHPPANHPQPTDGTVAGHDLAIVATMDADAEAFGGFADQVFRFGPGQGRHLVS